MAVYLRVRLMRFAVREITLAHVAERLLIGSWRVSVGIEPGVDWR